ncbi:hypothetical protein FGO68_gene7619 [Halteria grandinella]|uniref:Uncharacterized protein n=1 Tax=Halteria grandinella TaxID=5974 RepID=A0A8J8NLN1_HALGN|nr:hypothetical protein FGO68_gene7619 [Halteria grandinella]
MISLPQQPTTNLMLYYCYSMVLFTKILLALQAHTQENPLIIKNNAFDNLAYLSKFYLKAKETGLWGRDQGENLLDGGAPFYSIYKSKDKKYFAVGCIEPQFFKVFVDILGIEEKKRQDLIDNQMNIDEWPAMKKYFTEIFSTKTSLELKEKFKPSEACVTEVVSEVKSLKKAIFKNCIVKQDKELVKSDPVWGELAKELRLQTDRTIIPLAKL